MGDDRGWITWLWSKIGVMIAFFAALVILFMVYGFVCKLMDSDHANKVSRNLAEAITQVSNAGEGYKMVYYLPSRINDHEYMARIVESDNVKGIVIWVFENGENVSGGASLPASVKLFYQKEILHERSDNLTTICLLRTERGVEVNPAIYKTTCF